MSNRAFWIALTALAWVLATAFYWIGYAGADDLFYARYAYLFHRPPIVWWEFRMPAILAIRASFFVFGPTEFAAAFPSLLASLAIMLSVAWFVGWPRQLTWQSQSAMFLAAVIPIDVGFRSWPSANQVSAGLLAVGTVCILKGTRRTQLLGAALLALGFIAHEISFFYIALFCLTLLVFDRNRFWRPVGWSVALSAGFFLIEALMYQVVLGDPLARMKTSAAPVTTIELGVDPGVGLSGIAFFAWPLQTLVLGKHFGINLAALLLSGVIGWRSLTREQRILFTTAFLVFGWLGYGSMVPWTYKPFFRQFHYYNCLTLGVTALLPFTLSHALARREFLAKAIVGVSLAFHIVTLSVTGGWGKNVDVSRDLLAYAQQHLDKQFVTDVATINHMYVLSGFRLPENVVCVKEPVCDEALLVNKEPPGTPLHRFPDRRIDAALVNLEEQEVRGFEPEFSEYLRSHDGQRSTVAEVQYRPGFRPIIPLTGAKGFMVMSAGGEVRQATPTGQDRRQ